MAIFSVFACSFLSPSNPSAVITEEPIIANVRAESESVANNLFITFIPNAVICFPKGDYYRAL